MTTAAGISTKLEKAHAKSADLAAQLVVSFGIKAIWPDAFKGGQTCSLCAVKGMKPYPSREQGIARAWLKRADGVKFDITVKQYEELRR